MKTKPSEKKDFMNPYDLNAIGKKLRLSMKLEPTRPLSRDPYSTAVDNYPPTARDKRDPKR